MSLVTMSPAKSAKDREGYRTLHVISGLITMGLGVVAISIGWFRMKIHRDNFWHINNFFLTAGYVVLLVWLAMILKIKLR